MKRITHLGITLLFMLSIFSCQTDKCEQLVYTFENEDVYVTQNELRASIEFQDARDLNVPGKIYFYNNLLLINELYEGIHFIDNSDPNNPEKLSFLKIMGNTDFAIKDGKLYANNQLDLLTFDISNLEDIQLEHIAENTFREYMDDPFYLNSSFLGKMTHF